MWKAERFQRIRSAINTFGKLTIEGAAKDLEVSTETIRRDFNEMDGRGELKRIRGGAILIDNMFEPPLSQRITEQVKEKRAMAKGTALLVKSGQVLFVDAGSTTTLLADELVHLSGITVITNSVNVAVRMSQLKSRVTNENKTIFLGGAMNESLLATFGDKTIGEIYGYRADLALLSPVGLDRSYGRPVLIRPRQRWQELWWRMRAAQLCLQITPSWGL
jgi:DeoR family transcriptional regulator, fructose operon transcriptional repressor